MMKIQGKDTAPTQYNRAKLWQIALFALNMMSTNMYMFLMSYVSYYANGLLGMSTVFISSLATSMRIFDGFTDPIIGWLIDRTKGKYGKFRPFLIIGNIVLMTSMILMYRTTHLVPEYLRIPYFIAVYALYIIGYTIQGTVTTSAQSVLTNDPEQRPLYGLFTGTYMLFLFSGFSYLIAGYLVPKYGTMGYEFFNELILWIMAIALIFMILSFFAIAPKDKPEFYENIKADTNEKVGFKVYWNVLKNNKALQMLVISASTDKLATTVASNAIVSVMLFGIIIGDFEVMSRLSMISMIPNLLVLFIGVARARKAGQKNTYVISTWLCIILQVTMVLLFTLGDPSAIDMKSVSLMNVLFVVVYIAISGTKNIGGNMVIPMMADCIDYEVYRSGHYVPGLIATVYSFVDKLISSLGTTIVGGMIAAIGFSNSVPQITDQLTPEIFAVTMFLFNGMPILGWVASIIAMKYYPLTGEKMKEIQAHNADVKTA